MTLELAILGMLSLRPQTGYELKKAFEDSPFLYWSGSNNQIYHTLVGLHQKGWVTRQVQLQEDHPARKIYTITLSGLEALKSGVQAPPEPPLLRQPFFIQLAWADLLSPPELDALLQEYAEQVQMQRCLLQAAVEKSPRQRKPRGEFIDPGQARNSREKTLWTQIVANRQRFYENELAWIQALRGELACPA